MALPYKLKNYNLFNDGQNYIGKVPEINLPKLTAKMEEYRAGGMDAPIDIDLGMEKLTMDWTLGGIEPHTLKQFGVLAHTASVFASPARCRRKTWRRSRRSRLSCAAGTARWILERASRATTHP